jgi:cellulose synthase/poly-beta-1,6-N-acetylglucosamine synthase-like glycosyltransferase
LNLFQFVKIEGRAPFGFAKPLTQPLNSCLITRMNSPANPVISVVMPVHNALPFLSESIRSILAQTLADFEFVILDDASTDGSLEVLREWSCLDHRIAGVRIKDGKPYDWRFPRSLRLNDAV